MAATQRYLSNIGIFAIGAVALTLLFKGVASKFQVLTIPRPDIKRQGTKFILNLQIPIKNNSPLPIPVTRIEGQILYQNRIPLASIFVDNPITLKGGGQITNIPMRAEIGAGTLIDSGVSIIDQGAYFPSFWFKGRAYAGQLSIPINQNIQVI